MNAVKLIPGQYSCFTALGSTDTDHFLSSGLIVSGPGVGLGVAGLLIFSSFSS